MVRLSTVPRMISKNKILLLVSNETLKTLKCKSITDEPFSVVDCGTWLLVNLLRRPCYPPHFPKLLQKLRSRLIAILRSKGRRQTILGMTMMTWNFEVRSRPDQQSWQHHTTFTVSFQHRMLSALSDTTHTRSGQLSGQTITYQFYV